MAGSFPPKILEAVRKAPVIGIKIGPGKHRVISVWAVVVRNRIFIRSWSLKPDGWFHKSRIEPRGSLSVRGRSFPVRAVQTRSAELKNIVSRAYIEKYHTPDSVRYVKDLARKASRDSTTELIPLLSYPST